VRELIEIRSLLKVGYVASMLLDEKVVVVAVVAVNWSAARKNACKSVLCMRRSSVD